MCQRDPVQTLAVQAAMPELTLAFFESSLQVLALLHHVLELLTETIHLILSIAVLLHERRYVVQARVSHCKLCL